jgi:hypothetical protein
MMAGAHNGQRLGERSVGVWGLAANDMIAFVTDK